MREFNNLIFKNHNNILRYYNTWIEENDIFNTNKLSNNSYSFCPISENTYE